jgi:predicted alpha/beta superfamily hydrolase
MTKTISTLLLLLACQFVSAQGKTPFVLGNIETIKSKVLSENRTLNVYMPEGYSAKDTITYPVIYLLDGSADEDFIHIAGLVQYCNFPWINSLPKSIVVGIANVDRRRDYTFPTTIEKDKKDFPTTGGSAKFIEFLEKEVQPFITKNYKTNNNRTIIGQSLGGLLATEILLKKPELFSTYIIISPSLWWNKESLLALEKPQLKNATKIYIAVGNEGEVMVNDAKQLQALLKTNPSKDLTVNLETFHKETHADIMHDAVYHAFKALNRQPK